MMNVKTTSSVQTNVGRTLDQALEEMWNYYKANKSFLPTSIKNQRDFIIEKLRAGGTAEEAFSEALKCLGK